MTQKSERDSQKQPLDQSAASAIKTFITKLTIKQAILLALAGFGMYVLFDIQQQTAKSQQLGCDLAEIWGTSCE